METFHEMIAVDCYCCSVWPFILWLNVWGWALREQCSLHCTAAQITTWTGSSSAQSSASSRPPLKYPRQQCHCGAEYEGVCPQPWMGYYHHNDPHAVFFSFLYFKTQRTTRRWGLPHTESCRLARVAFLHFCLRMMVHNLLVTGCFTSHKMPNLSCYNPISPSIF